MVCFKFDDYNQLKIKVPQNVTATGKNFFAGCTVVQMLQTKLLKSVSQLPSRSGFNFNLL